MLAANFEPLISRLQAAVLASDIDAYVGLLTDTTDTNAASEFARDALRPNVDAAVVQTRFLLPLVVTMVAHGLGMQVLNGGMARVPRPTETLAAFALAWGIADFLASPLSPARQISLVLAEDMRSFGQTLLFVLACGGGLAVDEFGAALDNVRAGDVDVFVG